MEEIKTHHDRTHPKRLQSQRRNGDYVTLGTASMVGRGFAPKEKVAETHKKAHERSKATILKHRQELLDP